MSLKALLIVGLVISTCYGLDANFVKRHIGKAQKLTPSPLHTGKVDEQPIHTCIQDKLQEKLSSELEKIKEFENLSIKKQMKEVNLANTESTSFAPIRLHLDYTHIQNLQPEEKDFIQNKLMPPAKAYFESVFKVKTLTGPI